MKRQLSMATAVLILATSLVGCSSNKVGDATCGDLYSEFKAGKFDLLAKWAFDNGIDNQKDSQQNMEAFTKAGFSYCGIQQPQTGFLGIGAKDASVENPSAKLKDFKYGK